MLRGNPSRAKQCMKDECTGSLVAERRATKIAEGEFIED